MVTRKSDCCYCGVAQALLPVQREASPVESQKTTHRARYPTYSSTGVIPTAIRRPTTIACGFAWRQPAQTGVSVLPTPCGSWELRA
jgi:hypothetical protein